MKILLHSGPGLISRLIKWQTDSDYNHASLLFSDGTVIEAREFKGVVHTPLADIREAVRRSKGKLRVEIHELNIFGLHENRARAFAEAQVDKPYDYAAIGRFLSRGRGVTNEKWFCSELAYAATEVGGISLLRSDAWRVAPGDLAESPLLSFAGLLQ